MIVDTSLSVIEFKLLTEALADGYFDEDDNYTPHIGFLNSMRLFYNLCVRESKFDKDLPNDFDEIVLVESLANDDDFMSKFNKAIESSEKKLDFCSAFNCALDIVKSRNNPFERSINKAAAFIGAFFSSFSEVMDNENIEKLRELADQIKSGAFDYYDFMKKFGESKVMEKHFTDSENKAPSLEVVQ